jgi:hypothetical protein
MTATITTRDQMQQALEQLGRVYRGLSALREQFEAIHPRKFTTLAEGHLEEIRRLQHELDEYAGAVAVDEQAAPLWLRVTGPEIVWQSAPTSVLTAILDAFRKGVQSVAELMLTGGLATRPTASLKHSADFRIVALAPGSLRMGIRLPDDEGPVATAVHGALIEYLRAAAWVASDEPEGGLQALIPDERRRRLILTELARLVPRERGQVEEVELSGSLMRSERMPGRIALSRDGRGRINDALTRLPEQRVETHVGDLREIDLDRSTFLLRNLEGRGDGSMGVECQFPEELLEAAKEALDKRVQVTGSKPIDEGRRARPLQVTRLEIFEER